MSRNVPDTRHPSYMYHIYIHIEISYLKILTWWLRNFASAWDPCTRCPSCQIEIAIQMENLSHTLFYRYFHSLIPAEKNVTHSCKEDTVFISGSRALSPRFPKYCHSIFFFCKYSYFILIYCYSLFTRSMLCASWFFSWTKFTMQGECAAAERYNSLFRVRGGDLFGTAVRVVL